MPQADYKRKRSYQVIAPFLSSQEPNDDGEWKGWCPLHEDDNPSASFNFDKNVWVCFAGCGGGSLTDLATRIVADRESTGQSSSAYEDDDKVIDLQAQRARRRKKSGEVATDASVTGWHQALLSNKKMLNRLMKRRGLTLDTIKQFEIGWDRRMERYTIPVRDADETLLNVRKYQMDAPPSRKMLNVDGMGRARLFPLSELEHEQTLLITAGELDALLAIQEGFPAVTGTGGESTWKSEWSASFAGKIVYITYDNDPTGEAGARKVAHALLPLAKAVYVVKLPVEGKGDDLTDYFVRDGWTAADFRKLLSETPEWRSSKTPKQNGVIDVDVLESMSGRHARKNLRLTATITGRKNPPFLVPKTVHYECTMDAGPKCAICPMLARNGDHMLDIESKDPMVLQMLGTTDKQVGEMLRGHMNIPKCNRLMIEVQKERAVEELFVRPSVEEMSDETEGDYTNRRIFSVDRHDTLPNQTVRIIGSPLPNPTTQRNEFLAWDIENTDSSLDTFEVNDDVVSVMERFKPDKGQRPLKKMGEIARDLAANVTRIYGRTDMHILYDLAFHSVLNFSFGGKPIDKGWLDVLVLGDTRTGKSEAAQRIIRHYNAGLIKSCESASFAGIVGGLQQFGSGKEQWAVNWGVIPLNDRRLVALDEVAGLTQEQIAQMSSIRSSGIAQLTKIQTEATLARTRLIWLGNPRRGKMSDYTYGVHAIRPLVGNQEDIARFDLAMTVATNDVPPDVINSATHADIEHEYTAEACHTLLMWVWSRKSDQVVWAANAEEAVFNAAIELGQMYVEDPPLIQAANVRMKVARIAVAIAARTFSTDVSCENVVVRASHVQDAVSFINYLYGKRGFGYRDSSLEAIDDYEEAIKAQKEIRKYLKQHPGLSKFLRGMRGSFRRIDMEDMMNVAKEEANAIINKLWKARMVAKQEGEIRISPLLHEILRDVRE